MNTRCRSCRAVVNWLVNDVTEKRAPIDVTPTEAGNITINHVAGSYHVLTKKELAERVERAQGLFADPPEPLYTNHFQTCPSANDWRPTKPKKSTRRCAVVVIP